jgi:hypothetical protein
VADEQEVRRQAADPPIPVAERVDALEAGMEVCNEQHREFGLHQQLDLFDFFIC